MTANDILERGHISDCEEDEVFRTLGDSKTFEIVNTIKMQIRTLQT